MRRASGSVPSKESRLRSYELEPALEREEPLTGTIESLNPRLLGEDELAQFGDPPRLLFSVNDPRDLREAESLLAS
ncbi:MAG TPA: hypothetical protein VFP21_09090 [Solirubrobacterales bacterium]|nr:hypothetical protein [Solirubrobacterales bacterium]